MLIHIIIVYNHEKHVQVCIQMVGPTLVTCHKISVTQADPEGSWAKSVHGLCELFNMASAMLEVRMSGLSQERGILLS